MPTYSATFIAKVVLPIDGRPATIIKSDCCNPEVNLSKSEKQKLDYLAVKSIAQDARVYGDLQKPGIQKFINALRPGEIYFLIVSYE